MNVRPIGDRVIVRRVEADQKTKGGIVLPDTAKEKPKDGKVVAVGPGKTLDNGETSSMSLNEGDKVIFSSYAGTEVKIDGEEYLIMKEDDVLAVLE